MACQLICPNLRCRKILKVPEETRGKVVRCQYCQTMLRVPPARRDGMPGQANPSTTPSNLASMNGSPTNGAS